MHQAEHWDHTHPYGGAMAAMPTKDYYTRMADYHHSCALLCQHLKDAYTAYHEHTRLYHEQMMEHYRKLMG